MNLSRSTVTKGVSLLALCALVGVGYTLRPAVEPESMRLRTDAELEALADPLFEELFQDRYHRALEAYNDSKGLFSCDDVCQVHKRRLEEAEVELTPILRERLTARQAILARGREERLAKMQTRQTEAAILRASPTWSLRNASPSARQFVRQSATPHAPTTSLPSGRLLGLDLL